MSVQQEKALLDVMKELRLVAGKEGKNTSQQLKEVHPDAP
jgi:hypothetical protein